jgi:hypothetical protein
MAACTSSLRKMTDRCEKVGDRSVRKLAAGQVRGVAGDKKDENLHRPWSRFSSQVALSH